MSDDKPTPEEIESASKFLYDELGFGMGRVWNWESLKAATAVANYARSHAVEAVAAKDAEWRVAFDTQARAMAEAGQEAVKAATEELRAEVIHWRQARETAMLGIQVEREARERAEKELAETRTMMQCAQAGVADLCRERDQLKAEVERRQWRYSVYRRQSWARQGALRKRVEELEAKAAAWKRAAKDHRVSAGCWRQATGLVEAERDGLRKSLGILGGETIRVRERLEQARREGAEEMRMRALAAARDAIHLHDEHHPGHHGGVFPTCLYPSLNDVDAAIRAFPIDPPKAEPKRCGVPSPWPVSSSASSLPCDSLMPCPTHYPEKSQHQHANDGKGYCLDCAEPIYPNAIFEPEQEEKPKEPVLPLGHAFDGCPTWSGRECMFDLKQGCHAWDATWLSHCGKPEADHH